MFDSRQKATGTVYTTMFVLLAAACIFSLGLWAVLRPFGLFTFSLASVCSAICAVSAWIHWKRSSPIAASVTASPEKTQNAV